MISSKISIDRALGAADTGLADHRGVGCLSGRTEVHRCLASAPICIESNMGRRHHANSTIAQRTGGFTLVELLIVIGIIALLLAILMPTINRGREAGNRIKCMSNLRQLAMAFVMYTNDNRGAFPAGWSGPTTFPDAPYWVNWSGDLQDSRIACYIRPLTAKVLTCPADEQETHPDVHGWGAYPYSYVLNWALGCDANPELRINRVKNTSEKVLLGEEDSATINDGQWYIGRMSDDGWEIGKDYLSTRHDSRKKYNLPDRATGTILLPNARLSGNVAFVDGHSAFVTREFVHATASHSWPSAP